MAENVDNIDGTGGDDQLPPFLRKQVPITKSSGVIPPFLQKKEAAPTTQTTAPKYEEPTGPIGTVIPAYAPASNKPNSDIQGPKITVQPAKTVTTPVGLGFNTVIPTLKEDHQTQVDAASQRIHNEFKQIDPAVKSLLLDYKKQQSLANFQDQIQQKTGDMGAANTALQKAQHLLPAAAIKVGDDEVKDYKQAMLQDPALAREALYQQAKLHPDKAAKIAADVYLVDSKDRTQGTNTQQILENAKGIEKGDLTYPIWHGGQVTKPLGLVGSMAHGFQQREDQFKDYNFIADNSPEDVIKEMENRRNTPRNADEPIPVPTGLGGGFGGMVGSEGITMAKGAIPSLMAAGTGGTAEVVAPWVGAALTSPDFYKRGYANSFNKNYNDLRDEGKTPQDAYKTASDRASFDAKADVALGAVMTAIGGKLGMNASEAKFSPGFMGAVKGVAKQMGESAPEAGALGIAGGSIQALKNLNSGKEISKDVAEAVLTPIALHYGIGLIAGGSKLLHPDLYKSAVDNISKQPEDLVNKTLGEQVESKLITPQQANDAHLIIEDKRAQQEVLLNKAKDIVAKGKVEGISAEPLQHAALNDPDAFNSHLQNIAEQGHDPKTAEHTEEVFGKDLVNVAKQLYPHEDIQELIKNNRTQDLKEVDDEIKKLNPESEDYGSKKKELTDKKSSINDYYENYGKHIDTINSPKIADNETDQTGQSNAQTSQAEEVKTNGAAPSEPAPFSNQQKEAASGFIRQGLADGSIPKEYEGMNAHPEHVLNFIREGIANGKEADLEKEFGKDLMHLAKTENSYPVVKNAKNKSILKMDTDLTGDVKRLWMLPYDESKITKGRQVSSGVNDKGELGTIMNMGAMHKSMIKGAIEDGRYEEAIKERRMTSNDAKTIIESAGLDVPEDILIDAGLENKKIIKTEQNATGIEGPTTMDVRQQTGDGEEMGIGNAGHQEPAGESETENKNQGQEEKLDPYGLPFEDEASDKRSGIKNAISNPTRFERQLPKVEIPKLGSDQAVLQEGKELVDSGKINPREVVQRINSTNEGMHPDEAKAMQYYMHQLSVHETNLREGVAEAKTPIEKAEFNSHLQQVSDEIDAATEANLKSGAAWAHVGNIRQIVTDAGFNAYRERAIIKDAYGWEIPEVAKKKIDAAIKERDEAIAERLKAEERLKNSAAEKTLQKVKEVVEKEEKKTGKQRKEKIREDRKSILDELRSAIKKDTSSGYAFPFPTHTIPVIGKLAISYFKEGYVNLDELVGKVFEDIKAHFPNATKKDVRDAISQYDPLRDYAKETSKEKLELKEATINKKLASGDILDKKTNPSINFEKDTEWMKASQKAINAEYKLKQAKRTAFESKKNMYEKELMWAGRLTRLSVLSGYSVLGKLASAATIGGAMKRIPEQTIGKMYAGIFKGIAEKAPIEGMPNVDAEAKFYKEFFDPIKFGKNAIEILKSGSSPLSKRFGGGEYEHIPGLYLPTDLHQIIKDPLKRGTFEASFKNGMSWASKNGMDITDPLVIQALETAAYKRANYEIFQEQNALTKAFGKWKGNMEKAGNLGATGKFLADFMIPVSTVPTNIAKRLVSTSPLGLLRGSAKVMQAYRNGIENLSNEEADAVMRQLKQGTLGTALWLTGWFASSHFGGLYSKFNPDKKRKKGDFISNEMEINGKMIPKPVQHALPLEIMQLAATMRRIHDNYASKGDENQVTATTKAALGAIGAVIEQIPVLETVSHLYGAFNNPYEANKLKEDAQRRFEPQILKETGIINSDKKPAKTTPKKGGYKKEHRH